ncbi:MAG TPA: DUF177 domain-containing protein [Thermodesulfovibrionales bacterium]|nr:DUF177 domain-containing protein [Thermodesulfovibrionales bacterium]
MKVQVSDITDEGLDLEFQEAVKVFVPLLSPVKVLLRLEKVGSEVLAQGEVATRMELQCSRCLRNFPKDMDMKIDVVYHPLEELKGEEKHEVKEDELNMGFYKGDELDIQDLIVEQILLSVPMKPLCSESCRGICPRCGADMNANPCRCEQKGTDPRLAVLKKLLDEGKE